MSSDEKTAYAKERLGIYNLGKRDAIALMRDFADRFKGVDGAIALRTLADTMVETLDKLDAEGK